MKEKTALIVGGSNGLGLALAQDLSKKEYERIIIADITEPAAQNSKFEYLKIDLNGLECEIFDDYMEIETLIITAGLGRLCEFKDICDVEIIKNFNVNAVSPIAIIKKYYDKLIGSDSFDCVVIGSIAGWVSSPMFSVYSATKAAVCKFVEAVNIELEKNGTQNRILNVSPGSLKGTRFNGGENDISLLSELATEITEKMKQKCELFIPDYDEIYKEVINRYISEPHKFGVESFEYKLKSGRINKKPQIKIGYLSGTFDLFHVGHLNLLRRAKQYCDYLVVGVHKDASHKGKTSFVPFEERVEIVKSIKYVDEVIPSLPEDMDVYEKVKYDFLFVGSDYKGSKRFAKYEEFFKDKDVQIIYFPYTKGTSSTKIREVIEERIEDAKK